MSIRYSSLREERVFNRKKKHEQGWVRLHCVLFFFLFQFLFFFLAFLDFMPIVKVDIGIGFPFLFYFEVKDFDLVLILERF